MVMVPWKFISFLTDFELFLKGAGTASKPISLPFYDQFISTTKLARNVRRKMRKKENKAAAQQPTKAGTKQLIDLISS